MYLPMALRALKRCEVLWRGCVQLGAFKAYALAFLDSLPAGLLFALWGL